MTDKLLQPALNPSPFAYRDDGTASSSLRAIAVGPEGERRGYIPARGAGVLGEAGRGAARGITEFARGVTNTFGMDQYRMSLENFLSEHAHWYTGEGKSAIENVFNFGGAVVGQYAPMFTAQVLAGVATGGASVEAQIVGGAVRVASAASKANRASRIAGAGVAFLQSFGDNKDRIDERLPQHDELTRLGLAIGVTAAQSAIEVAAGPERSLAKAASARRILSESVAVGDKSALKAAGLKVIAGVSPWSREVVVGGGLQEAGENLLQELSMDAAISLAGGNVGTADEIFKRYVDAAVSGFGGGLIIGTIPATLNSMNRARAAAYVQAPASEQERSEVDSSPVTVNGQKVVDEAARRRTQDFFTALRNSLPEKQRSVAGLIENLAYKWAYAAKAAGEKNYRPERVIDTLRLALLQDSAHSDALSSIAVDGVAAGRNPASIIADQISYIRDNMPEVSGMIVSLQESVELMQAERQLQALRGDLQKKSAPLGSKERSAASVMAAGAITGKVKIGSTISAADVLRAFSGAEDLLKRAYVEGSIPNVQIGDVTVSIRLNEDLSATIIAHAASVVDESARSPGDVVSGTRRSLKASAGMDGSVDTQRGDSMDGIEFAHTRDLAKARAEIVRMYRLHERAENFDIRMRVAQGTQPTQVDKAALGEQLQKLGVPKDRVAKMSVPEMLSVLSMPQPEMTLDEFIAKRAAGLVEQEKNAKAEAERIAKESEEARKKADYDSALKKESDAQIERARANLEEIRNRRALAERDAVAEFYARYPAYAERAFNRQAREAIVSAMSAVEDGRLRSELAAMLARLDDGGGAVRSTPAEREQRARDEFKTLDDAMSALEQRRPDIRDELFRYRKARHDMMVAMHLRNLPDEPEILLQGASGQYIRSARLALFYKGTDASTVVEELFHHMVENSLMPSAAMQILLSSFGAKGDDGQYKMDRAAKENAVHAFLAYVKNGKLPKGSKLIPVFNLLKAAIQNHLDDLDMLVVNGGNLSSTGEPIKVPDGLKRWFDIGVSPRARNESAVIYGRALTDSMMTSDYGSDSDPNEAVLKYGRAVDEKNPDAAPNAILNMHPDLFGGVRDWRALTPTEKFVLSNILAGEVNLGETAGKDPIRTTRDEEILRAATILMQTRRDKTIDPKQVELHRALYERFKAGDKSAEAEAQRLVDEAAKALGFTDVVYHGSPTYGFTVFDKAKAVATRDSGFFGAGAGYFTDNKALADRYAMKQMGGDTYAVRLQLRNPYRGFTDEGSGSSGVRDWFIPVDIREDVLRKADEAIARRQKTQDGWATSDPFSPEQVREYALSRAITETLKERGYDGVIAVNKSGLKEYVAFDSSQIKSADPFTFDSAGNLIPLDQRFNPDSDSILFQVRRASMDFVYGDKEQRAAARTVLNDIGVGDDILFQGVGRRKIIWTLMRQYANAYGLEPDDPAIMETIRRDAFEAFGERATKMQGGERVLSIGSDSELTEEDLLSLAPDVTEIGGGSPELLNEQLDAARSIEANSVEGFRSPINRSSDGFLKRIGRGGLSVVRWLNRNYHNLYTLVEYTFGTNPNNPAVRSMIYAAKRARATFKTAEDAFTKEWGTILERLGYKSEIALAQRVDVGGYQLTRGQVIFLYTISNKGENFDTPRMDALRSSSTFSSSEEADAVTRAAVNFVKNKEPVLDGLVDDMQRLQNGPFQKAREVAISLGLDVPEGDDNLYATLSYANGAIHDGDIADTMERAFDDMAGGARPGTTPSELKAKTKGSGIGLNLDAIVLFDRHVRTMLHFSSNAQWVHDSLALMSDQIIDGERVNPIRDAMQKTFGDNKYFDAIVQHLRRAMRLSNTLRSPELAGLDGAMRYLRNNAGRTYLSYNPWVVNMQPISGLHVIGQMGIRHAWSYLGNIRSIIADARSMGSISETPAWALVRRWSPDHADMLKSRHDRHIKMLNEASRGNPFNISSWTLPSGRSLGNIAESGQVPMQATDAIMRVAAWKTAFDSKVAELSNSTSQDGSIQEQAARYADRVVGFSFNPADPNEVPLGITEASEFSRTVQMFSGQPLSEFRGFMMEFVSPMLKTYYAARRSGASRGMSILDASKLLAKSNHMRRMLFTMALPGIALGMASRRRLPTFQELIFDMTLGGVLTKLPLVGPVLYANAIFGYSVSESLSSAGPLKNALSVFDELSSGNWSAAKTADAMRQSLTIVTGTPDFIPKMITRFAEGVADQNMDYLESLKRASGFRRDI